MRRELVVAATVVVAGAAALLWNAEEAQGTPPPTITPLSPTSTFAGSANPVESGSAQDTSCTFSATDGATPFNAYAVTAAVSGANNMASAPVVTVRVEPTADEPETVYFRVHAVTGPNDVIDLTSSATITVTVTSPISGLGSNHSYTIDTVPK